MLDVIRANAQSWGVKIAFGIIILVFVFWGVGSFSSGSSNIALTVNKTPITLQEFQSQYESIERRIRDQMPGLEADQLKSLQLGRRVVQQLVMKTLLANEAERAGIVVTPQELRQVVEAIPAFHNTEGKFDPETYKRLLQVQRETPGHFEAQLRDELLADKLRHEVTAGAFISEKEVKELYFYNGEERILEYAFFPIKDFLDKVKVTEDEIKKWYEDHQSNFRVPAQADVQYLKVGAKTLAASQKIDEESIKAEYEKNSARYTTPERVKARHILLTLAENAPQEEVNKVKGEIDALAQRLKKGEDFAVLAKEYSKDTGSAPQGGELGWFFKEQMVAPFADAAFALKPKEISKPVRTQFGYHLIQVEEHEAEVKKALVDVHDTIKINLATEKAAGTVQDVLEQLQLAVIGGKSLNEAGKVFQLKAESTGLKDTMLLTAQMGIKPDALSTLLASTPGTTLDTPFVTKDGYLLVKLNEYKAATIKPLTEVSAEIKTRLEKDEALKLAMAAAKEKRQKQDFPKNLQKTKAIGRDGIVPDLNERGGSDPNLSKAAFKAQIGEWLPDAYALDEGAALMRVVEILQPTKDWDQASGQIQEAVLDAKRQQMFQSFLSVLQNQAKIEIRNQKILEQ